MRGNILQMNIFYALCCLAWGSMFFVAGIHGLRKNYIVTHDSDYIIVEGIRGSIPTKSGRVPTVKIEYNGKIIIKTLASTKNNNGDKILVYYNPNSNDHSLRVVGGIDNLLYIVLLILSLPLFCAALLFAFPNFII